jgi:hypothetical protein
VKWNFHPTKSINFIFKQNIANGSVFYGEHKIITVNADVLLQRMKQDEKVSKTILRQHPAFGPPNGPHTQQEFDQRLEKLQEKMKDSEEKMKDSEELFNLVQAERRSLEREVKKNKRLHGRGRSSLICEGGGILKIRRNVTVNSALLGT